MRQRVTEPSRETSPDSKHHVEYTAHDFEKVWDDENTLCREVTQQLVSFNPAEDKLSPETKVCIC